MDNSEKLLNDVENIFDDIERLSVKYHSVINECQKNGYYKFETLLGPPCLIDCNYINTLGIVKKNIKQKIN